MMIIIVVVVVVVVVVVAIVVVVVVVVVITDPVAAFSRDAQRPCGRSLRCRNGNRTGLSGPEPRRGAWV